jgi:hypothetical protein
MMERKCAPDIDQLGVVADPYKLAFEYTFGMGIRQIDLSMGIKVITDAMFVDDSSPRDFPREEKSQRVVILVVTLQFVGAHEAPVDRMFPWQAHGL